MNMVSIIIVNWNGKKWLKNCLDSISKQSYKTIETIVVDNNSSDGSVEYLKQNYLEVKLICNTSNLGFAPANNIGLKQAKGDYIFFLNNDTIIESNLVEELLSFLSKNPSVASVQPKLVLMDKPTTLDVCGSYWTDSTLLYHYGMLDTSDLPEYNKSMPFFSNKGAAMMVRKEVLDKLGAFDDDFWCYYEETDLCHRIWLCGYECWYHPKVTCFHALGASSNRFMNSYIQYHNFKNKLMSFLKNFELKNLLFIMPIHLLLMIGLSFYWLLTGKIGHFLSIYRAIFWNIKNIKMTLIKRSIIQNIRTNKDSVIRKVTYNPTLGYYKKLLFQ